MLDFVLEAPTRGNMCGIGVDQPGYRNKQLHHITRKLGVIRYAQKGGAGPPYIYRVRGTQGENFLFMVSIQDC